MNSRCVSYNVYTIQVGNLVSGEKKSEIWSICVTPLRIHIFFFSFSFYDSLICCLLLNIPHIPRLHNQPYDKRDLLFYGSILPKSQWDQMFSSSPLYLSRILSSVDVTIKLRLLNQETLLHFYRQTK